MVFAKLFRPKRAKAAALPAIRIQDVVLPIAPVDASEVFVAGAYPEHTFVQRKIAPVSELKAVLKAGGKIACISGPSRVGKTVLCQNLVGEDRLIRIRGAQVDSYDKFIGLLRGPLNLGEDVIHTLRRGAQQQLNGEVSGSFQVQAPFAAAELGAKVGGHLARDESEETQTRVQAIIEQAVFQTLCERNLILMIDDFHRVPNEVQKKIVAVAKDYLVDDGFRLILAAIPSRVYDPVRANPEMIGRYESIEIPRWSTDELVTIATDGFGLLHWHVASSEIRRMAKYAFGNPLLMQDMCQKAVTLVGGREFNHHRGLDVDRVLAVLGARHEGVFDVALTGGQGKSWWVAGSTKPLKLGQLALLAASEFPWNHVLSIPNTIVPKARELAAKDGANIKAADVMTALRGVSERLHNNDSPLIFFEIDEASANLVIRDPYLRFYLQAGLRTQFGMKLKEN